MLLLVVALSGAFAADNWSWDKTDSKLTEGVPKAKLEEDPSESRRGKLLTSKHFNDQQGEGQVHLPIQDFQLPQSIKTVNRRDGAHHGAHGAHGAHGDHHAGVEHVGVGLPTQAVPHAAHHEPHHAGVDHVGALPQPIHHAVPAPIHSPPAHYAAPQAVALPLEPHSDYHDVGDLKFNKGKDTEGRFLGIGEKLCKLGIGVNVSKIS